jgi:uncharacterized protein YqgV (UPF0045/DUF77 family)
MPDCRVEFLVEPFIEGSPGDHVTEAISAMSGLEVTIGPFGNVAQGPTEKTLPAIADLLERAFAEGATRVSLQVSSPPLPTEQPVGSLHGFLRKMISQVEDELGDSLFNLSREKKQAAVRLLDRRGAFLLRKSIEDVADAMGVSRITIYNYLNAIRENRVG